jgi:hypothetical protein
MTINLDNNNLYANVLKLPNQNQQILQIKQNEYYSNVSNLSNASNTSNTSNTDIRNTRSPYPNISTGPDPGINLSTETNMDDNNNNNNNNNNNYNNVPNQRLYDRLFDNLNNVNALKWTLWILVGTIIFIFFMWWLYKNINKNSNRNFETYEYSSERFSPRYAYSPDIRYISDTKYGPDTKLLVIYK